MAVPKEQAHAPFLTQMTVLVSNPGFQTVSDHYERPCRTLVCVVVHSSVHTTERHARMCVSTRWLPGLGPYLGFS